MIKKRNAYFVLLNDKNHCHEQGVDAQQQKNAILNFLMAEKRVVVINVKNEFISYIEDNYKVYYEDYLPKDNKRIYIYMLLISVDKDFFTGEIRVPKSLDGDSRVVEKFENPVDFPRGLKMTLPIDLVYSASLL